MAYINGVNQEQVKKQIKKESVKTSKPESKDIKVFGNLTTGTRAAAQPKAHQEAQAASVFVGDATSPKKEAVTKPFGSLTTRKTTAKGDNVQVAANMQIFSQKSAQPKMEEIASDNNVRSELAATTEAMQAENMGNVGSRFDSAAPEKEMIVGAGNGIGNRAIVNTSIQNTNYIQNNTFINKQNRWNGLMDSYARYITGHSKNRFYNTVNDDFNRAINMNLHPGAGGGCCTGGGALTDTDCSCGCNGTSDDSSSKKTKHHTKHDKRKRYIKYAAIGGIALAAGGVTGYFIGKKASSKAESTSVSKTNTATTNSTPANVAETAKTEVAKSNSETNSLIKEMKEAKPENYESVMEKAETQYAANETELANIENNICDQQAAIAANEQKLADNKTQIEENKKTIQELKDETLNASAKQEQYKKSAQDKRSEAAQLVAGINDASMTIQETISEIADIRAKMAGGNLTDDERNNLNSQLKQLEQKKEEAVKKHAQLTQQKKDLENAAKVDEEKAKDFEELSKETENKQAKIKEMVNKYQDANSKMDTESATINSNIQQAKTQSEQLKKSQTELKEAQTKLYRQAQKTADANTDPTEKGYKFSNPEEAGDKDKTYADKYRIDETEIEWNKKDISVSINNSPITKRGLYYANGLNMVGSNSKLEKFNTSTHSYIENANGTVYFAPEIDGGDCVEKQYKHGHLQE